MSVQDQQLWRTITLLFLSKIVSSAQDSFAQKDLINEKNLDLAEKFCALRKEEIAPAQIKACMKKALKQLEQEGSLIRAKSGEISLSEAGYAQIQREKQEAMAKIATSFPSSVPTATAPDKTN